MVTRSDSGSQKSRDWLTTTRDDSTEGDRTGKKQGSLVIVVARLLSGRAPHHRRIYARLQPSHAVSIALLTHLLPSQSPTKSPSKALPYSPGAGWGSPGQLFDSAPGGRLTGAYCACPDTAGGNRPPCAGGRRPQFTGGCRPPLRVSSPRGSMGNHFNRAGSVEKLPADLRCRAC